MSMANASGKQEINEVIDVQNKIKEATNPFGATSEARALRSYQHDIRIEHDSMIYSHLNCTEKRWANNLEMGGIGILGWPGLAGRTAPSVFLSLFLSLCESGSQDLL